MLHCNSLRCVLKIETKERDISIKERCNYIQKSHDASPKSETKLIQFKGPQRSKFPVTILK